MEQKRYTKLKKAGVILMALATLGPFSACQKQPEINNEQINTDYANIEPETPAQNESHTNQNNKFADINPSFKPYKDGIVMDEESVLKIIKLAMSDAQHFYKNMGAPNMVYDKDLKIVTGDDNFYPSWQNEYFYMGKAMAESSFRVDVVTDIKNNPPENDAHGIMQICPQALKETLQDYYQNIFGVNIDLSDLEVVPAKEDVAAAYYSNEAKANIVQAVYNNIYLAICYDIYNVKCLNPISHQDYYQAYGGFDENIRKLAAIGLYGTRRDLVLNGLKNGNLEEELRDINDLDIYLNNIDKFEKSFKNKHQKSSNFQPGM